MYGYHLTSVHLFQLVCSHNGSNHWNREKSHKRKRKATQIKPLKKQFENEKQKFKEVGK